jgi:SPASM domain peptide maturase of grasp-with-spasm system|nr:hypothetical protein [uncultured Psychroserpens sp.]
MKIKKYFKLYSYNVPVQGDESAIIVSFQNSNYTEIPQFLCEILINFEGKEIKDIEKAYDDESNTILSYFKDLVKKEIGFFTDTPDNYPKIEFKWESPEMIKSAVIEIDSFEALNYEKLLKNLDELNCKHLEFWFSDKYTFNALKQLLINTEDSTLRSISIILPFKKNIDSFISLSDNTSKLTDIQVYNCPKRILLPEKNIYGIKDDIDKDFFKHKNYENDEYIIYVDFFSESIKYNPYYNKKVCIDKEGYIKNCLSHKNRFGNIKHDNLKEIIQTEDFQDLWFACNDKIEEFKGSPFRYIMFNSNELRKNENGLYNVVS